MAQKLILVPTQTDNNTEQLVMIYSVKQHLDFGNMNDDFHNAGHVKPQTLILVDTEAEIKLNDLYIDDAEQIRKSITDDKDYWAARKDYNKILASSSSKLTPNSVIDQSDLTLIVVYYNKNGKLPEAGCATNQVPNGKTIFWIEKKPAENYTLEGFGDKLKYTTSTNNTLLGYSGRSNQSDKALPTDEEIEFIAKKHTLDKVINRKYIGEVDLMRIGMIVGMKMVRDNYAQSNKSESALQQQIDELKKDKETMLHNLNKMNDDYKKHKKNISDCLEHVVKSYPDGDMKSATISFLEELELY